MAPRNRPKVNQRQTSKGPSDTRALRRLPDQVERQVIKYSQPFMLMEDAEKNTFIFQGGNWVPYEASIAECRQTCLVKQLPQKVNGRTRYEIRCPE